MIKSLTLAAATIVGLSTLANAAIHPQYRDAPRVIHRAYGAYAYHSVPPGGIYYGAGPGTGAAAHFQDQFNNY